ncbi:hypothetical protein Egran_07084 [Elaphomyces granulatus]|uniref:EF-hand domain-containing protein n=1 Tax=Elaphomyces granulatus TaxID=519963 RepID=A0A232LME1_9EURO|nr:hypothetical protein Egran_07084 [Elaphomyces granulatus]
MPSFLHDSHQAWVNRSICKAVSQQALTPSEYMTMKVSSGTRFNSFLPPYQNSEKEPDLSVTLAGMMLPTIVFETGYSQSLTKKRDLWLRGGKGSVQIVFIIKWNKSRSGVVKGDIEVFASNQQGSVLSLQKEKTWLNKVFDLHNFKLPEDEDTPEKRVRKIFRKDENGCLDIQEFKEGSKRDETIVSALSLYNGLV